MSFYGNISNAGKTQLNFDKVYPNRYTMETNATDDNVFIGRYILIEYDDNTYARRQGYIKEIPSKDPAIRNTHIIFSDTTCNIPLRLTESMNSGYGLKTGDLVVANFEGIDYYFQCTGKEQDGSRGAYFSYILSSHDLSNENDAYVSDYTLNYQKDKDYAATMGYEFSDGWDSTVWQKVYENGTEYYQMIAALNSKTPSFYIASEPPSMEPVPPHFGENSTNLDYTLHVQPTWGFKIKETESEYSDVDAQHTVVEIDENTGEEITKTELYDAAIFYNRAGLSPEKISYISSDQLKDEINILPTGYSGKKYIHHDEDGQFIAEAPDIQELVVNLPSIGNTISNVWDIVYGGKDVLGDKAPERNMDIQWGNSTGLRLVRTDPDGHGFTYNPAEVSTLAGCINSIHDLMGAIIAVAPSENQSLKDALDNATTNKIYYGALSEGSSRKSYYFKDKTYKFISFEEKMDPSSPYYDEEFDPSQYAGSRIYFDLTPFMANEYYTYADKNFYSETNETPTPDTNYYKLGNPIKLNLKEWNSSIVEEDEETGETIVTILYNYYKNEYGDYIKDQKNNPSDEEYFSIIPTPATAPAIQEPENVIEIYNPHDHESIGRVEDYFDQIQIEASKLTDIRSGYFYMEKTDGKDSALVALTAADKNEDFDADKDYYYIPEYAVAVGQDSDGVIAETLWFIKESDYELGKNEAISFASAIGINDSLYESYKIELIPFKGENYYIYVETVDDNGKTQEMYKRILTQEEIDKNIVYYTIDATFQAEGEIDEDDPSFSDKIYFYKPDTYFYLKDNKDYILDRNKTMREGETYYYLTDKNDKVLKKNPDTGLLIIDPEDVTFYEPGKYYYRSVKFEDDVLDNSTEMKTPDHEDVDKKYLNPPNDLINGQVYYEPQKAFVINDEAGVLSKGQPWDKNVNPPEGVQLGVRVDDFQWTELSGFAKTMNTIHGLILQLNQFFKFNDTTVRNNTTVAGILNQLNDILNSFNNLHPGGIVGVDGYGRLTNMKKDAWIESAVDSEYANLVNISHAKPQTATITKGQSNGKVLTFGDKFNAINFGIDEKGHVVHENFTSVEMTLPSLKLSDTDSGDVVVGLELIDNNQTISLKRDIASKFKLTNYEKPTTLNSTSLAATDSFNDAFGKLEYQLDILNAGSTQEGSVSYQIAQIVLEDNNGKIDKLNEIANWIVSDETGAAKMAADINTLNSKVDNLDSLIDATKVDKWDAAEPNVISDWAEVDETSDKFIANKPDLNDLVKTTSIFDYTYNENTTQMTINELLVYIAGLESRIALLEQPTE